LAKRRNDEEAVQTVETCKVVHEANQDATVATCQTAARSIQPKKLPFVFVNNRVVDHGPAKIEAVGKTGSDVGGGNENGSSE
jgi:hypothetical protein